MTINTHKLDSRLTEEERKGALQIVGNPAFGKLSKPMQERVADLLNQVMLSTRPTVTASGALFGTHTSTQQECTEDGLSLTLGVSK